MNYFFEKLALLLVLFTGMSFTNRHGAPKKKHVVIGYVTGFAGVVDADRIDARKLTHINYAFIDIKDNRAWLHNEKTDTVNFRKLNLLKQQNPTLKILISIGGWNWSKNFSDAALTDTSRKAFAQSAVAIINSYGLDGVDIDWEYPNMQGNGNVYRKEDKEHYTLLLKAIRNELDSLHQLTHKKYLLTTAVGGFSYFTETTEMGKAQSYLDYVNVMTYDYGGGIAGHHTSLYASKEYQQENSADKALNAFVKAGVPYSKLVMGIAFYGRGGIVATADNNGLGQKIIGQDLSRKYTYIKDSMMGQPGFASFWDNTAKAAYLFNASTRQFISYDDERSIKEKCNYVLQHKLAGVMFWEYSGDLTGSLLSAIDQYLQ